MMIYYVIHDLYTARGPRGAVFFIWQKCAKTSMDGYFDDKKVGIEVVKF
jgi:hypothetical protein